MIFFPFVWSHSNDTFATFRRSTRRFEGISPVEFTSATHESQFHEARGNYPRVIRLPWPELRRIRHTTPSNNNEKRPPCVLFLDQEGNGTQNCFSKLLKTWPCSKIGSAKKTFLSFFFNRRFENRSTIQLHDVRSSDTNAANTTGPRNKSISFRDF